MERKLGMSFTSRKKLTKNIWKCLEWIIFFSLMATAMIFASEVIEKFVGQSKSIKQNMEEIESHPTVTICPFLEQCDGPMKLTLRLQGAASEVEYLTLMEGRYDILSSDLINGKPYWMHQSDDVKVVPLALWYNAENEKWIFGHLKDIGSNVALIFYKGTAAVPYEATGWYYWNHHYWNFTTTDVVVDLG